jgi:lysophospholipase L1-like esterase
MTIREVKTGQARTDKERGLSSRLRTMTIAFTVLAVLGSIFLVEFIVYPYKIGMPRDVYLMGFAATPHSLVDDTPINALGFTGDVIAVRKPPGTIRILTLGGSAMFNRRMTQRLKDRFNLVATERMEILGAALRTHTTASSILKHKLLSKYRPDFVLIYHGINDLWANHVLDGDFKADYSHLNPWYKRNYCLDHSVICRLTYNNWMYRKPTAVVRREFGGSPGEEVFRQNLLTLIKAARENGSVPILMTFAWTIPDGYTRESFKSGSLGYNNPTAYDSWPVELWGPVGYVREGLQAYNKIVREISRTENVFLIDQEYLMGKDPYWFGDVCHLSEEGTDEFIKNIVTFFVERGLIVPRKVVGT